MGAEAIPPFFTFMGMLVRGIIWLLRRCIAAEAKDVDGGREGRIAKVLLIFPLFLFAVFGFVAWYVLSKPVNPELVGDPAEVISGWALATFIPAILGWMLVYFLSFRVLVVENVITVSSLVTRRKQVRLDEPFSFHHDEEQDKLRIVQGSQVLKLGWIVNGYAEFLNLAWIKSRRWP